MHPDRQRLIASAPASIPHDELPAVSSIVRGRVVSIKQFGAFVGLEGRHGLQGLVHISELSRSRVESVSDVVEVGDSVFVKVLEVRPGAPPKLSLSMKYCDQGTGADLDANAVDWSVKRDRQKPFAGHEPQPLTLDAVLHTTCARWPNGFRFVRIRCRRC